MLKGRVGKHLKKRFLEDYKSMAHIKFRKSPNLKIVGN